MLNIGRVHKCYKSVLNIGRVHKCYKSMLNIGRVHKCYKSVLNIKPWSVKTVNIVFYQEMLKGQSAVSDPQLKNAWFTIPTVSFKSLTEHYAGNFRIVNPIAYLRISTVETLDFLNPLFCYTLIRRIQDTSV